MYRVLAIGADPRKIVFAGVGKTDEEIRYAMRSNILLFNAESEQELETALEAGAEVIGINHRDLRTFQMDMTLAERLRPRIPKGKIVVAESGISTWADVMAMKRAGANAVLVGEALLTAQDVAAKVRELVGV